MIHDITPFFGLRHPVSSGTHIIAFLLSALATYLLWRRARGHFRLQLAAVCFGLSMMLMYAASGTFHALRLPWEQLRFFWLLDMSAIYVLIAGTYTPALVTLLPEGSRRQAYFAGIWLVAVAGIAFKVVAVTGILSHEPYWISAFLYVGMGWFALALIPDLLRTVGVRGLQWAAYGGLVFTLGVAVELGGRPVLWPRIFGSHELFHVCAMAGTFCFFIFTWGHVLPYALAREARPFTGLTERS